MSHKTEVPKWQKIINGIGNGLRAITGVIRNLTDYVLHGKDSRSVGWDDGNGHYDGTGHEFEHNLMDIVFTLYGIIAGVIAQNYAQYQCRVFAAWAANESLQTLEVHATPLSIIANCIIVFTVYLGACVLEAVLYWLFRFWLEDKLPEGKYQCQVAYAYGVTAMIIMSLICLIIPGNLFF